MAQTQRICFKMNNGDEFELDSFYRTTREDFVRMWQEAVLQNKILELNVVRYSGVPSDGVVHVHPGAISEVYVK